MWICKEQYVISNDWFERLLAAMAYVRLTLIEDFRCAICKTSDTVKDVREIFQFAKI
jgi:hypothetical protein